MNVTYIEMKRTVISYQNNEARKWWKETNYQPIILYQAKMMLKMKVKDFFMDRDGKVHCQQICPRNVKGNTLEWNRIMKENNMSLHKKWKITENNKCRCNNGLK